MAMALTLTASRERLNQVDRRARLDTGDSALRLPAGAQLGIDVARERLRRFVHVAPQDAGDFLRDHFVLSGHSDLLHMVWPNVKLEKIHDNAATKPLASLSLRTTCDSWPASLAKRRSTAS